MRSIQAELKAINDEVKVTMRVMQDNLAQITQAMQTEIVADALAAAEGVFAVSLLCHVRVSSRSQRTGCCHRHSQKAAMVMNSLVATACVFGREQRLVEFRVVFALALITAARASAAHRSGKSDIAPARVEHCFDARLRSLLQLARGGIVREQRHRFGCTHAQ